MPKINLFSALLLLSIAFSPLSFAQTEIASSANDSGNEAKRQDKCNRTWRLINNVIYKPNKSVDAKDNQQVLVQTPWQILKSSLRGLPKEQVESIFEGPKAISFAEIDALFFAIKSGKIRAKAGLMLFVSVLRDIGMDHPSLFNGKSDTVERLFSVLDNAPQRQNRLGVFGDAQKAEVNLKESEENLIAQAMSEMRGRGNNSTRIFDGYRNTFSPHTDRIEKMIEFNANMRKVLNLTFIADESPGYVLNTMEGLNASEKDVLNALLNDTRGKIQASLDVIKQGFNNDMVGGSPVLIGDLRLRQLQEKLEALNGDQKLEAAVREAEQDMDQVENVVVSARKRQGQEGLDYPQLHDRHLQIRFDQHLRKTVELAEHYAGLINNKVKGTEYTIQAEWTVTVNHERWVTKWRTVPTYDSQGKQTGTKLESYQEKETWTTSYGMEDKFTLKAEYQELLNGEITPSESEVSSMLPPAQMRGSDAVSASNGSPTINWTDDVRMAQIVADSREVMALENETRLPLIKLLKEFDAWVEKYDNARSSNSARDLMLSEMDATLSALILLLEKSAKPYASLSEQALKSKWAIADYGHFKQRSTALVDRTEQLTTRLKFFREEVRRQIENLGVYTQLPDYTQQLKLLKRLGTERQVRSGVKHAILIAAIATSVWIYNSPVQSAKVKEKWKALTEWWSEKFGNGDNGDPSMIYTEGEGSNTPAPESRATHDPTQTDQTPQALPDPVQVDQAPKPQDQLVPIQPNEFNSTDPGVQTPKQEQPPVKKKKKTRRSSGKPQPQSQQH